MYRTFEHTEGNEQADRLTGHVFECLGIYLLMVAHNMLSKAGSRDIGSYGGGERPLSPQHGGVYQK
jgi:hypothetical protein